MSTGAAARTTSRSSIAPAGTESRVPWRSKIAGIRDNLDTSQIATIRDRDRERLERYRHALARLGIE
jgi:hypothetical protein